LNGWDALREERYTRMVRMGLLHPEWPLTPRDPEIPAWSQVKEKDRKLWDLKMAVYAAQIDRLDQNVGKLLAALKETGADRNTLVLFLSDNGGTAEHVHQFMNETPPGPASSHASYGRPWANASNTPFRLYKHWVHEGGISTPFI